MLESTFVEIEGQKVHLWQGGIGFPVLMLHGRNDQPCPADETTLVVAESLEKADIKLFGNCGHNLPRERTSDYLAAANTLFA